MSKITLTDLVNLENQTTAVNAINSNNTVIKAAFDNTLSRDGTSPNTMSANLDMNSNRVLNLQDAISPQEPATFQQLSTLAGGGTIILPALPTGGATGTVLKKNSATNFDASFGVMGAAGMPALTGDVTSSVGTVATTIANSVVTNAKLANAAAFTLKGNSTAGSAAPTDLTISGLTAKTPATSDLILISDEAASHALKKATLATSAVTSIAGNRGDFTLANGITNSGNIIQLSNNSAITHTNISDPTGTTLVAGAMMGLNASITPVYSTRAVVCFTGQMQNSGTGNTTGQLRFGTGTAPVNGATPPVGTNVCQITSGGTTNGLYPATFITVITGLTPGTTYWLDMALAPASGTGSFHTPFVMAFEI